MANTDIAHAGVSGTEAPNSEPKMKWPQEWTWVEWRKPEMIVQLFSAVLVLLGLGITAYQISLSTNATNAQNIYTVERESAQLFEKAAGNPAFQSCFGPGARSARLADQGCVSLEARSLFLDLLQHYRVLRIMASKSAIPQEYYEFRLQSFCPLVSGPQAKAELRDLKDKLDKGLSADLVLHCKI